MRWLGSGVDDAMWPLVPEQVAQALSVTDVQVVVPILGKSGDQLLDRGPRGSLAAKKLGAHIIVYPHDIPALTTEHANTFGSDQSSRASNECLHFLSVVSLTCG